MADQMKIDKLQKEIENIEMQFEKSKLEAMFDKSRSDQLYKQLKKKRKELKLLTDE